MTRATSAERTRASRRRRGALAEAYMRLTSVTATVGESAAHQKVDQWAVMSELRRIEGLLKVAWRWDRVHGAHETQGTAGEGEG